MALLLPRMACRLAAKNPPLSTAVGVQEASTEILAANPLPLNSSVQIEDLTWMEVRDKVQNGYKRVIIPTGGIEQNGPFVALNKHDLIVKEVAQRAAKIATGTLVAPVVSFVPEGDISPPSGHMRFPGTISVTEATFVALLDDITTSLATHGFTEIVLLGDSGDSQAGLATASANLHALRSIGVSVRFEREFYNYDAVRTLIREQGILEHPEPFHEELAFSLQLLAIKPSAIRYDERIKAGHLTLGGVSLIPHKELLAVGEEILNYRAHALATLIQQKPVS